MKPSVAFTPLVLGILGFCQVIHGAAFTFATIDVPDSSSTAALGINDVGQIVGLYSGPPPSPSGQHGFVDTNGVFTPIDPPGSPQTLASDINNAGQVVGSYVSTSQSTHFADYLDDHGVFTAFGPPPGGGFAGADGPHINDAGAIVGSFNEQTDFAGRGYLYNNGVFTTINFPGATSTGVGGINDAGEIVGQYTDSGGTSHVFLDNNGVFTTMDINIPGGGTFFLTGINNAGEIVGYYQDDSAVWHGFVDNNGDLITIDAPGAFPSVGGGTYTGGINNAGQVVGYYFGNDHVEHGFLATPTPEPASLLLLAFGLAGLLILIVRRRVTKTSNR
jgi:uncharacterized membrane protein